NAFLFGIENFARMRGQTYNVGLSDANLSKAELCDIIKKHIPEFHVTVSEYGKDPDKRDYIVSNETIERTEWKQQFSLDDGIVELIKSYRMIRNAFFYDNIG